MKELMTELAKHYNFQEIEEKWQKKWEEWGVYRFNWNDYTRPVFSIDTPPPYPSGDFHMGNVLNWTYFDIVARYKRMKGYNVYFPQGWDCHGLGIEVQVEKQHNIRKKDLSSNEFRKLCEELVEKYIAIMKRDIIRMGCSVDWTTEYRTMDPNYWRRTQLSFIILYNKGFIYKGTHPVNWCPRCETAIADAEVDHETRESTLNYIKFPLENSAEHLTVATTRPELLPACVAVAVNPNDERYHHYIGKRIHVPITNRTVEIITDEMVDPKFGTGIVMICTYGDKADVKAVIKNNLPRIMIITEDGKLNEKAGKYAGLNVDKARKAIIEDLRKSNLIEKIEKVTQEVGICTRCETPIEILEHKQWFMNTRALTDLVEKTAHQVKWYPDYMKYRLIDWAKSLDWDWVISRQRIFATPIPLWYCEKCGEIILAKPEWIPIDPKIEPPKIEKCPKCGHDKFISENDVFDTWMDSSITCAVHAGWPDREDWRRLFPADMHPSGTDIIRTWAYYLMVRHLALFNETPYKSCLINGMVLGLDGRKMSKSLGNYIAAPEVLNKYGADTSRQWAAGGGTTGSDIPFRWPDVEYARRFLLKLWNATRFISLHLKDYKPQEKADLEILDKWLIAKLNKTIRKATEAYDNCQFNIALEEIRKFAWHILCDCYIEAVKDRLYRVEFYGQKKKDAALHTLYFTLYHVIQLLAPISPYITEEIYQTIFAEHMKYRSIHVSPWPEISEKQIDREAEKAGDLIMTVIEEIRRSKASRKIALNKPIKRLEIYAGNEKDCQTLSLGKDDIMSTCKIEKLEIRACSGEGEEISGYPHVRFVAEY
jgi:valyl-tRNA synthetase